MITVRRTWHQRGLCFGLSLLLLMGVNGCAPDDGGWKRVQRAGVLRVGMDASFPPFEFVSAEGDLMGFDVDLAMELGRRLGVEVAFVVNLSCDGFYDALRVDRVDVVISSLVVNPAGVDGVAYSQPYFESGQVLVTSGVVGADEIGAMADLAGRSLAVAFGSLGDMEARRWKRRLSDLTVVSYQTADEALTAVVSGETDAALVDHVSALMAPRSGDLHIVGKPVLSEPYAVALRREDVRLRRLIDQALAEMAADGTRAALTAKWLQQSDPAQPW